MINDKAVLRDEGDIKEALNILCDGELSGRSCPLFEMIIGEP